MIRGFARAWARVRTNSHSGHAGATTTIRWRCEWSTLHLAIRSMTSFCIRYPTCSARPCIPTLIRIRRICTPVHNSVVCATEIQECICTDGENASQTAGQQEAVPRKAKKPGRLLPLTLQRQSAFRAAGKHGASLSYEVLLRSAWHADMEAHHMHGKNTAGLQVFVSSRNTLMSWKCCLYGRQRARPSGCCQASVARHVHKPASIHLDSILDIKALASTFTCAVCSCPSPVTMA